MFQYPGFIAYQMPSIARANLQAFLSASQRFASGVQALTELNVQTVRTVIEESNTLLRTGDDTTPGEVLGWQSVMFAQLPQKAASYGQHVLSIITSTEAEIIGEVRSQYERNGITLKGLLDTSAQAAQETTESTSLVVTELTETANEAAENASGVILDASGEIANESAKESANEAASETKQLVLPADSTESAPVKAPRTSSRRQV
ncbi:phasin family protein [Caballeronia sp. LZ062]|uniref:phasin family protein n=1 Tax=unclassified Caballeronia TaxID=2646786 RepID=UPI0028640B01|nr:MULTISPECIES: phasin family protein [unclassified Caballeronia]MDR5857233.1 phasin family protein [Caballeronia sp. LZ050]MDR5869371.1 phasin family protein [Caballeronia sp. LZ062]